MLLNQVQEFLEILRICDTFELDQLEIAILSKFVLGIVDVSDPARHTGGEVPSSRTQNDGTPAGHILAAVVADPLNHGQRAGISDTESLGGLPAEIRLALDGSVKGNVADEDVLLRAERGSPRGINDDAASGQPLADIVVGVPFKFDCHSVRQPRAQTLTGRAGYTNVNGVVPQTAGPPILRDAVAQHRTEGAIDILDTHFHTSWDRLRD